MWVPRSPAFSVGRRFSGSARGSLAKDQRTIRRSIRSPSTEPSSRMKSPSSYAPPMPGALVTGAGRGLGLEIARRLAVRDYEVAVADLDEAEAISAARQLGDRAWALPLDVTDPEAVRGAADQLVERCGSVDAWVNNAGILITGLAHEQPIDAYRRQLDVNYLGTVNGTLAAIDRMRPAGRGHIINVISLAGLAAATGLVGYSASKHAAIAFSLGTAADLKRSGLDGIRISCVCPDGVWTP